MFWSKEQFKDERDLLRSLGRERSKDLSLDYGLVGEETQQSRESLSENARLEAFLRQGLERAGQEKKTASPQGKSFEDFKIQFEAHYPEKAKQLQESTLNAQTRQGLAALQRLQALEKETQKHPSLEANQALGRCAAGIQANRSTFDYLRVHHAALAAKIETWAKPYAQEQAKTLQRALKHELGEGRHL